MSFEIFLENFAHELKIETAKSSQQIQGQPGLQSKVLSKKNKIKNKDITQI